MKIDIEGSEFECVQSASHVIQESRPVIFLATHGPEVHMACTELLAKWKYRVTSLDGRAVDSADELIAYP
jgi:hypothetical protein